MIELSLPMQEKDVIHYIDFLLLTITCAPRNKVEAKSEGSQIGRPARYTSK